MIRAATLLVTSSASGASWATRDAAAAADGYGDRLDRLQPLKTLLDCLRCGVHAVTKPAVQTAHRCRRLLNARIPLRFDIGLIGRRVDMTAASGYRGRARPLGSTRRAGGG